MMNIPTFPKLSDEKMRQMLALPSGKLRVVVDTDAKNEIDDQWALAWALLSQDQLEIEGMYAAPFSFLHHREPLLQAYERVEQVQAGGENVVYAGNYHEWAERLRKLGTDPYTLPFPDPAEGMELSYEEILKIYDLLDENPTGKVFRGSPGYLKSVDKPYRSEAVDHLIERAMANDDRPLYVVAIGAVTNIACALLLEPKIVERIVVLWTSAYPSFSNQCNRASLNLMQDLPASKLIFDSGVPHVYLPGFYIGEQLKISLPESKQWVNGRGKIGNYLHHLYTHNPIHHQRGIADLFSRTWIMWDLINIAWLLNPDWVHSEIVHSPILDDEMYWQHDDSRHLMREAVSIDRDAIFRDLIRKLPEATSDT
jgi:inosine-uridine nucleoside N-ribohydrolase